MGIYVGDKRYAPYVGSKRRRYMGGGGEEPLPQGAVGIEYLESTGTQWIDTGYKSNNIDSFEFIIVTDATSGYMGSNGNLQVDLSIMSVCGKRNIKVTHSENNGPKTYVNGTLFKNKNFHNFNGFIIGLFALGMSYSAVGLYSSAAVFSSQLIINDNLVRDFIPVRVGQTGYMYDKVSGELFGNSGTGDFILGPDINN